jgi:membrane-bound lytic murein transglycosylase D
MVSHQWRPALTLAVLVLAGPGCASRTPARLPAATPAIAPAPPPIPAPPPVPAPDPIATLIAASQQHFERGQQELSIGHLDRARAEFDHAIDVLVQSPYGARYDTRLREHFDRLVDRISAYEATALAEGDGFTEKRSDPASIDSLLEESTFAAAPASVKTQQTVASDLEKTAYDISIPLNDRVLAYIELFQGRLREWFATGLQRGARYLPMIQNVFRAEGLPLDLAYVPIIESAFNPNAVSRAKARGVWQFMAATAVEHGLKRDWYVDERSDPEKATRAAASYLQALVRVFGGDWHLALASYNGGPGTVQRAINRSGLDDFWSLAGRQKYLPRETREYVPMILAAIVIARNPAEYGFEAVGQAPLGYEKVKVPRPVDLRRVAEWAGTTVSEIQGLNPELRRLTTPVRYPDYEIKVPVGAAAALEARFAALTPVDTAAFKYYTVKRGDTLGTIAKKLRVGRTDLAEANYLSTKALVSPGQNLIVPVEPAFLLAGHPDRPVPVVAEVKPADVEEKAVAVRAPAVAPPPDAVKVTYQVKRGDTLSSVARLYRTTVQSLKVWNRLAGDRLMPGSRLTIFASRNDSPRP